MGLLQVALSSFGGGLSVWSQRILVEERGWMSEDDVVVEKPLSNGMGGEAKPARTAFQTLYREGISTGHNDKTVIGAGIDRGFDAIDHFLLRHNFLVRAVTAALGTDLVFNMQGCRSGFNQ